jgi:hypothetical protein
MTRHTHTPIPSILASLLVAAALVGARPTSADPAVQADARVLSSSTALSIPIMSPEGKALRLDYLPGNGWRSTTALNGKGSAYQVTQSEAMAAQGASDEHPLSVFVDGPTGFVFVWVHDAAGWKFVGRVGTQ